MLCCVAVARNKYSPSALFRSALSELGRILIYEAVREWLPVVEAQIETPLAIADVTMVDPEKPIKVTNKGETNELSFFYPSFFFLSPALPTHPKASSLLAINTERPALFVFSPTANRSFLFCVLDWCCWSRPPR